MGSSGGAAIVDSLVARRRRQPWPVVVVVVVLMGLVLAGCARAVPRVRFVNAPIAWEVDDRRDVPTKPKERVYWVKAYRFDHLYVNHFTDPMKVEGPKRATNVNALGEVPSSSWFTNRVGVRELSVDEIRIGPDPEADPQPHKPWTILRAKATGAMPGFLMADARGVKYLLKFEEPPFPEMESAAEVIVQRLLWAAGYNVPANTVVWLRPRDLVIAPDAIVVDAYRREHRMTQTHVDKILARVSTQPDGRIRAIASRFLPGKPIGGYAERGVRADDPNDLVPHEDRRELRAQYVFFGWLGHTDLKENAWVDVWREDPSDAARHYVEHYLVDFGKALGAMGATAHDPGDAYAYATDPARAGLSLVTLGIWTRPGEAADGPDLPGIGRFEAAHFHPAQYRPRRRFRPFDRMDEYDALWAAKVLLRLRPEHIRAAVEEGHLGDPRAHEYMIDTLIERQQRAGKYWLSRVNALDDATIATPRPGKLRVCITDLLLAHGFSQPAKTRYTVNVYDDIGRRLAPPRSVNAAADGRLCVDRLPTGAIQESYTMVSIATRRGKKRFAPVWVHVARVPNSEQMRVVGVWRE